MDNAITKLFKESGMSIRDFATKAELKYSTAHDIVTGKANIENIGAGAFVRIARTLGTTADALLDSCSQSQNICDDEWELVSFYRRMMDEDKKSFMNMARTLACAGDLKKEVSYGVVELAGDDVM